MGSLVLCGNSSSAISQFKCHDCRLWQQRSTELKISRIFFVAVRCRAVCGFFRCLRCGCSAVTDFERGLRFVWNFREAARSRNFGPRRSPLCLKVGVSLICVLVVLNLSCLGNLWLDLSNGLVQSGSVFWTNRLVTEQIFWTGFSRLVQFYGPTVWTSTNRFGAACSKYQNFWRSQSQQRHELLHFRV